MRCPVCKKEMIEEDFGGVKVDTCKNGCKGIWFDWVELRKLDEADEGCGAALQEALNYPRTNDETRGKISCPKCNTPMHVHKYQSSKEVNVDECYICGGFFLDSGELGIMRDTCISKQEQETYLQKLLDDIPSYQQKKADIEKEKIRADALHKYTRFLRLSYYLTGK